MMSISSPLVIRHLEGLGVQLAATVAGSDSGPPDPPREWTMMM
jgi:hypothetical protein